MKNYADLVKGRLSSLIKKISEERQHYVKNPDTDFTRKRKLPLETVIQLIISMGGGSIYKELLEAAGYDTATATSSAFVQQRSKLLPDTFEFLLHEFMQTHKDLKMHRGYRLLAADGADLHIATNPSDIETYAHNQYGGYNHLHLNALYDLKNKLYVDALVQPKNQENERKALINMVNRSRILGKVIAIGDRGFEGYNCFAHIERKGWNYLIRVKDINSNGITSHLSLPDGEFDINIHRLLTRKQGSAQRQPHLYKFLSNRHHFDFLPLGSDGVFPISFRVVRFRLDDGTFQTVITNLSQDDFSPKQLKNLYALRWGIETSFRALKYAVGLNFFHSKKRELIAQEIFARLIMYNFTEMITSHVVISQADNKHLYQVNFSVAVLVCRRFLRPWGNAPPLDVEALIRKNILPVRNNRKFIRNVRSKRFFSFLYRVA